MADEKEEVKEKTPFVFISGRNETDADSFLAAAGVASLNHVGEEELIVFSGESVNQSATSESINMSSKGFYS